VPQGLGKVHDPSTARVIFHVDLDAFFVAVERVLDPSLYGKPVVVGGSPEGRGVVAAASYEARAYGVRSAMPMSRAVRLCPHLLRVRGSRDAYRRASRAVFGLLREATPCIQKVSIDEAYLDLSDQELVHGRGLETAWNLQHEVKQRFRLDLSIGIASNCLVAKIASGASKPSGVLEVLPGHERAFLSSLPIRKLPGIGPATAERLHAMRIRSLGELVAAEPRLLEARLGRGVESLQARARGEDATPVRPAQPGSLPKSISHETTFPVDRSARNFLEQQLAELLAATTARVRKLDARARTVSVKLRFDDFTTQTRDRTLIRPGREDADFLPAATELLRAMHDGRRPIRLLGVKLAGLEAGTWQPDLFAELATEGGSELPDQASADAPSP
jgi:DNA polymerase IV